MNSEEVKAEIADSSLTRSLRDMLFSIIDYFEQEIDRLEREIKDIQGE